MKNCTALDMVGAINIPRWPPTKKTEYEEKPRTHWKNKSGGKANQMRGAAQTDIDPISCTSISQLSAPRLSYLTLFIPAFLGLNYAGGGQICPHPLTIGGNGWEVPKLSWNLISYRDWCQTKGFTTFRHLEPPQRMVWKSDFFWWFMRFVRVP